MGRPASRGTATVAGTVVAVLAMAAVAFAAWEGTLGRFSSTAHWSVLATIGATVVVALAAGRGRQRESTRAWARAGARAVARGLTGTSRAPAALVGGTVVWIVLFAATVAWDLRCFLARSHALPTLSRLIGDVTDHEWGRAFVFVAWLGVGAYLATGWRLRGRGQEPPSR